MQQHPLSTAPVAEESFFTRTVSRRSFLNQIALVAGVAVVGCTPARILLKAYPKKFDGDPQLIDSVLRSFVTTVVPGAPADDPNLIQMFHDPYYPLQGYIGFFVSDLCRRSAELFNEERFDALTLTQRSAIVRNGLNADAIAARMYRGAILMAQASFYGGVYNANQGCDLIDFDGVNTGFRRDEMCYPGNDRYMPREATRDGNFY